MISQSISKVKLFLSGIISRLKENLQYFNNIKVIFKSGTKSFDMIFVSKDNELICDYLGNKTNIKIDDISDIICRELEKYDSAVIIYSDRLSGIEITADGKNVSSKNIKPVEEQNKKDISTVGGRDYIVKGKQAEKLLKAIGIMAPNNKIKNDMIRKYNQIDRFIELISDIPLKDNITVMDCACGKSYLSFVLNYYFTELKKKKCTIYGIDYNDIVIKDSNNIKDELNYNNMKFIKADLKDFVIGKPVDMVISLHACDIATDYAIYAGIHNKAKAIVCVPCCHKELSTQIKYEPFNDVFKHGIFKRRFCDILTDALRILLLESEGYKVSLIEYISPLDTPKNLMIKAVKVSDKNEEALQNYKNLRNQFNVYPKLEELLYDGNFLI